MADFRNFQRQYESERREDRRRYDEDRAADKKDFEGLPELAVIIRLVGVRRIAVGIVLLYLFYPLLAHKIGEFFGLLSK